MTFYDQKTMPLLHTKNNLAVPAVMKTNSLGNSYLYVVFRLPQRVNIQYSLLPTYLTLSLDNLFSPDRVTLFYNSHFPQKKQFLWHHKSYLNKSNRTLNHGWMGSIKMRGGGSESTVWDGLGLYIWPKGYFILSTELYSFVSIYFLKF